MVIDFRSTLCFCSFDLILGTCLLDNTFCYVSLWTQPSCWLRFLKNGIGIYPSVSLDALLLLHLFLSQPRIGSAALSGVYIALEIGSNFPDCFFTGDHLSTIYNRLYGRYTDTLILSDQLAIVIVMFKAFHFSTHEKRDFMTQEWKEFEHHNFSTQGIHGFPCAESCITPFFSLFGEIPQECIRVHRFPCTYPILLFFSTNPHQVHVDGVIGAKSTCLAEVELRRRSAEFILAQRLTYSDHIIIIKYQWSFLVSIKGGTYHIYNPPLAIYTTYILLIYCLLFFFATYHLLWEPMKIVDSLMMVWFLSHTRRIQPNNESW